MAHLRPDQVTDCAEGIENEPARSHWLSCPTCRTQVEELRATIAAARAVNVPEPSPLFWDHFSARVHQAVQAEAGRSATTSGWWVQSRFVWAGSLALILFAVWVGFRIDRSSGRTSLPPASPAERFAVSGDPLSASDDPALAFVADLASELDWEAASEAGLTTHLGVDDDAVAQLSDGERRALRDLLKGELARPRT